MLVDASADWVLRAGVARKDYCDNLKIKNTLAGGDGSVLFEWRLVDWRI
ncbi:hypothetical protein [Bradyrhizobium australafricanum]|nr:hypothetical protein [Bradyrhizobium australafricanum]MCA6098135.1 hypothetical protein [Bradyrhizobium australafricanum]